MDPQHLGIDQRLIGMCIHCGATPTTRDHVPAKVLLDEPYPRELPVLHSCEKCNTGASADEQYVACFIESVICGSTEPARVRRAKIQRILNEQPALQQRIACSMRIEHDGTKMWQPEVIRVQDVVLKLARGHAAYELYPRFGEPSHLGLFPLENLTHSERDAFENGGSGMFAPWPEINSRAFMRVCGASPDSFHQAGEWIIVQPGRYRYAVGETGNVQVRIVLSEYLACEVIWE